MHLAAHQNRLGALIDQSPGVRMILRRQCVVNRFRDQTVLLVPVSGPAMQLGHAFG